MDRNEFKLKRILPPFDFILSIGWSGALLHCISLDLASSLSSAEDPTPSGFRECIFIILLVFCALSLLLFHFRFVCIVSDVYGERDAHSDVLQVHFVLVCVSRAVVLCNALWPLLLASMTPFYKTRTERNLFERWMTSWWIDVHGWRFCCCYWRFRCVFSVQSRCIEQQRRPSIRWRSTVVWFYYLRAIRRAITWHQSHNSQTAPRC